MTPDEFIQFCKDVRHEAQKTGSAGAAKTFFAAIHIGYEHPNLKPPGDDDDAVEGYKIGLELRKAHHEKFK